MIPTIAPDGRGIEQIDFASMTRCFALACFPQGVPRPYKNSDLFNSHF